MQKVSSPKYENCSADPSFRYAWGMDFRARLLGPSQTVVFALAGLVLFTAACGTTAGASQPSKRVALRNDERADAALADAVEKTTVQTPAEQVEVFLAVRKAYPETLAGEDALYRAGVIFFETRQWARARQSFNELLFENPLHPQAEDAKKKQALAALEMGAYRDAYITLQSLADRATGDEQKSLREAAGRAAQGAGMYSDALRLAIEAVDQAQEPETRESALAEVERLVESGVGFPEVERTYLGLSTSHPAWPLVAFKVARVYYHLREWDRLRSTLERFLSEAPGHPYARSAQTMLTRATQRAPLSPRSIGVLLPLTGKYKLVGEGALRAIQLAFKDAADIELVVKDTQGDPNVAADAMEQLAYGSGVIGVVGSILSDDAKRAALIADQAGIPIVSLAQTEGITALGEFVFRNMITQAAQADALAEYATRVLGVKSFGVLYPSTPYGEELAHAFWDAIEKRGGVVRGAETYDFDQTTFTPEVKKLVGRYYLDERGDYLAEVRDVTERIKDPFRRRKALEKLRSALEPVVDFDALFIPDSWQQVGLIAPAMAVEDIITNACDPKDLARIRKTTGKKNLKTVTLLGSSRWSSPKGRSGNAELIERGGKFVTCSVYVDGFFAESSRPQTKRFVKAFTDATSEGRPPTLLEANAYDTALIMRLLLNSQKPQSREALRDALIHMKPFEGVTGRTLFDAQREAQKPLFLLTLEPDGVRELRASERVVSDS
ncbi:MAG: penicillin-binding protein activator [Myxococcaceae bacterium]